jgi:hypothetical protein
VFVGLTPAAESDLCRNDAVRISIHHQWVNLRTKNKAVLPIGRTARIACQIEALRAECCKAGHILANQKPLDDSELEECARLDDALSQAQRLLKNVVGSIIIGRLRRRSRADDV